MCSPLLNFHQKNLNIARATLACLWLFPVGKNMRGGVGGGGERALRLLLVAGEEKYL